jgi:hypothetical protein
MSSALCRCPLIEIRVLTSSSVHSRGLDDFIASQMICGKPMMGSNLGEQEANLANRSNAIF